MSLLSFTFFAVWLWPSKNQVPVIISPKMALLIPFLVLCLCLCVAIVVKNFKLFRSQWYARQRQVELIERIPGPPCLPLLGLAHQFRWRVEEFAQQLLQYARDSHRMGFPLIRLWVGPFPVVCAFGADATKAILENTELLAKGPEYQILRRWLGNGLLTSEGQKWRERRKLLTPAFHFAILGSALGAIEREAKVLVDCLHEHALNGQPFDIGPYIRRCALDIICETAMGQHVGAQLDPNNAYLSAVQRINELIFLYSRMPIFWLSPVWHLSGLAAQFESCLALLNKFTSEEVPTARKAFLDLLLNAQREHQDALSDEDIREEVETFMFEGHDTTASGMGWTLWCLAHSPQYQARVDAELDAVFESSEDACTAERLGKLNFLEKCIRESLRLFPPVPLFTRRVDKEFDCVGFRIPDGTTLLISPLLLHRNHRQFANAECFDPDGNFPDGGHHNNHFAYVPFSAGQRNCIGQRFAMLEEKVVLATLLRHFWLEPASDGPAFDENIPCPEVTLKPHQGFPLCIRPRFRSQ